MLSNSNTFGPPDDWLELSEAERAKVQQLARDLDLPPQLPVQLDIPELREPESPAKLAPAASPTAPTLADVVALAESLKPNDRMRLVARMWESLPPRNRAKIIVFGLENIQYVPDESDESAEPINRPSVESIWPKVWEFLFDPTKTSGLYSAPRRFDLATIFVVTAAYSIVFGVMSSLNYYGAVTYFGPVTQAAVGVFITVVALIQALYHHDANPRGVSIVAGAITQTIIVGFLATMNWFSEPFPVVIVFYGLISGAFSGYLAGVIVGGVFLVADALRGKFENRAKSESNDTPADSAD